MNISFNITDELGDTFISASRWKIDRPDISDTRVVNKYLKNCIGELVDSYVKNQAIGVDEQVLLELRSQATTISNQLFTAERAYHEKKRVFEAGFTPTDTGAV